MEKDLNRSQIAALKAYPIHFTNMYMPDGLIVKTDINTEPRKLYQKAYEQAEKDTIERAAAWLKDYIKYFELYDEKGVEEFKKAMEEE